MSSKSIITFFMIVLMTLFGIGQSSICEDMCKEIGAYPKCDCPGFSPPDKTPNTRTWEEILESMDRKSELGSSSSIKGWKKQA